LEKKGRVLLFKAHYRSRGEEEKIRVQHKATFQHVFCKRKGSSFLNQGKKEDAPTDMSLEKGRGGKGATKSISSTRVSGATRERKRGYSPIVKVRDVLLK